MTNLINFYIIVVDDPNERLEFQFVPNEVSINSTASTEGAATPSRNNSRFIYYGGDDAISFTLNFVAENDTEAERREIKRRAEWLRSLRYDGRDVLVVCGDLFDTIPYGVESVGIKYTELHSDGLPTQAEISLSLKLNPSKALTFQDIRN